MYVNVDGKLKAFKRIELTSDSSTNLLHIKTETISEELYECPSGSPNFHHLCNSPQKSTNLATSIVETKTSVSKRHLHSSILTINPNDLWASSSTTSPKNLKILRNQQTTNKYQLSFVPLDHPIFHSLKIFSKSHLHLYSRAKTENFRWQLFSSI